LWLAPGPTEHYRVFEEIYSAGIGTRKADMIHEETYESVEQSKEGKPQTTRICDPYLIRLLELEAIRRGQKSLSSAAEQLLTERFMQIECLTDRGFMSAYGHKIEERKLVQKDVEKKLAAAVTLKTEALQAEVDKLQKANASMEQMLSEWRSGKRVKMRVPTRAPAAPDEHAPTHDNRTADEIEHDMEMQSRKG
jgi:hypothetical protein